jgi:hypothetical protein
MTAAHAEWALASSFEVCASVRLQHRILSPYMQHDNRTSRDHSRRRLLLAATSEPHKDGYTSAFPNATLEACSHVQCDLKGISQ